MIKKCSLNELEKINMIINQAAEAFKGVIPMDCWHEPYMPLDELKDEIDKGVVFYGFYKENKLVGVMGIQNIKDVTLIRHSYVYPGHQNQGIGGKLLSHLREQTVLPVLIGTWADAVWAIRFYEKHGFKTVPAVEKDRLLKKYWTIPEKQIKNSVVLVESKC